MKLPAELKPESVIVKIDTREQFPYDLSPMRMEQATLRTGDYTLAGLEQHIAIERKAESDLLSCCGVDRERFEYQIDRLLAFPCRALVIESTWDRLEAGEWRSKVTPNSVIGSLLGWQARGLPVLLLGSHERAGQYVAKMLYLYARRRWREARALVGMVEATKPEGSR